MKCERVRVDRAMKMQTVSVRGQQRTWIKSKVHSVAAARADFEMFSPNFIARPPPLEWLWQRRRWRQGAAESRVISRLLSPCLSVAGDGGRSHSASAANVKYWVCGSTTECCSITSAIFFFFVNLHACTCVCLVRHGQMCFGLPAIETNTCAER